MEAVFVWVDNEWKLYGYQQAVFVWVNDKWYLYGLTMSGNCVRVS